MTKPIVAVDIDDVLAFHAKAMVAYSNRVYGTHLTINDYSEHWSQMWQIDHRETEKRAAEYHKTDDMLHYEHHQAASVVLRKLAEKYRLIVVTARRTDVAGITEEWLLKHFKDIFESIHHVGIWDKKITDGSYTATKAEYCKKLGVSYLIDDQSKHCNGAAEVGITAIMFGDYPWNKNDTLHSSVVRCADWSAVERFFDGE